MSTSIYVFKTSKGKTLLANFKNLNIENSWLTWAKQNTIVTNKYNYNVLLQTFTILSKIRNI